MGPGVGAEGHDQNDRHDAVVCGVLCGQVRPGLPAAEQGRALLAEPKRVRQQDARRWPQWRKRAPHRQAGSRLSGPPLPGTFEATTALPPNGRRSRGWPCCRRCFPPCAGLSAGWVPAASTKPLVLPPPPRSVCPAAGIGAPAGSASAAVTPGTVGASVIWSARRIFGRAGLWRLLPEPARSGRSPACRGKGVEVGP